MILNVVKGSDSSKICRLQLHFIFSFSLKAFSFHEVINSILNQLAEEIIDVLSSLPWKVVIVRVLSNPSVHECPSNPIDRILFALYGSSNDIRIQMILKAVVKLRLNRERFLQELNEILFLRSMTVEDALCL